MTEQIQCALKGCTVMFLPYRPANIYHSQKCRRAAHFQKWFRKLSKPVVRTAKTSDTGQSEAFGRLKAGTDSTITYRIRCMAGGLETLARERPAFFLRLLASVERDAHHYIGANSAQVAA